jgi:dihydroflavonol-4-reductase
VKSVFVTGATGILGSNVCEQLIARGDRVRAIVRDLARPDSEALRAAGVETVLGDVADMASIQAATEGMDAVIHCAAVLGRPGVTLEDCVSTNLIGTLNVLSAAAAVGGIPVVEVITLTFFDTATEPLSETSSLDLLYRRNDPYSLTKRLGYVEGMARVADGQDIRFMIPGAIYGPSICLEKTVAPNSWNGRLARAIRGEMDAQLPLPIPYVTAEDCAFVCIAALDNGSAGQRYIAHGVQREANTMAGYANRACEMAGVPHRVEEIAKDRMDDPDIIAKFGPTMPIMVKSGSPDPLFDSSATQSALGYVPTSIEQGFPSTIDWLGRNKFL